MLENNYELIVTGTDPASKRGGIAFALPGYFSAFESAGIPYHFIPTHDVASKFGKWLPWIKAFYLILRKVVQIRSMGNTPILYCHVGGGVASFVRQSCVAWFAKALRVKSVMQLHGLEVDNYLQSTLNKRLFKLAVAPVVRLAVLTEWWQKRLRIAGIQKEVSVIPNPLPAEWERKAYEPRISHKSNGFITVLCLTRLEQGKGVDDLINAFSLLPNSYRLIIAGDGSQHADLQSMVEKLKLTQRIVFKGWVSDQDKYQLFDNADIFCLPTRYDSFGLGFLEAMANGLPVVAYNWGAIGDVVENGRCGYLSDDFTPSALAKSITQMSDTDSRISMSLEAKMWVLEQFSADVAGTKIVKMLLSVNSHS